MKRFFIFLLPIVLIVASCSFNESLLSEKDLQSYYSLTITSNQEPVSASRILNASSNLSFKLSILPGGPAPSVLSIKLREIGGTASAVYAIAKPGKTQQGAELLEAATFPEALPEIRVPANLPDNYYELECRLFDDQEKQLAVFKQTILLYSKPKPVCSIGMYPGNLETGSYALFKLTSSLDISAAAWVVWKANDTVLKQSSWELGGDRIVLQSPKEEGIYSIHALVYPFAPPLEEIDIQPIHEAVINTSVTKPKIENKALPVPLYSLTIASGYPEEFPASKTTEAASLVGQTRPEPAGLAYGHVLGNTGFITSPNIKLPNLSQEGSSAIFTVPLSLLPDTIPSGRIFSITDKNNTALFSVSYLEGLLELQTEDKFSIPVVLSQDNFIQISLTTTSKGLQVTVYNNSQELGSGSLQNTFISIKDGYQLSLAGSNGLSGVYSSFSVYDKYYTPFLMFQTHRFATSLIGAYSFSQTDLSSKLNITGKSVKTTQFVTVLPGGSVSLPIQLLQGSNQVIFEARMNQGIFSLSSDEIILASVKSNGTVLVPNTETPISLGSFLPEKRIIITVSATNITLMNPATGKSLSIIIPKTQIYKLTFSADTESFDMYSLLVVQNNQ